MSTSCYIGWELGARSLLGRGLWVSHFLLAATHPQQFHPGAIEPWSIAEDPSSTGTVTRLSWEKNPRAPSLGTSATPSRTRGLGESRHPPRESILSFSSHIYSSLRAVTAALQTHLTGLERITLSPTQFSLGGCFSVSLAKQKNSNTCTN